MSPSNIVLQSFHDPALAEPLVALLDENNIPYDIEDTVPSLDITFAGSIAQHQLRVIIPGSYLEAATKLRDQMAKQHLANTQDDEGHYLLEFSIDELWEVLKKQDEWSREDILMSQELFSQKGEKIDDQRIKELWDERLADLRKPEKASWAWIFFAFIFSLPLGFLIAWYWMTIKKTDPTGYKSYVYTEGTRQAGTIILILAMVNVIIGSIWLYG